MTLRQVNLPSIGCFFLAPFFMAFLARELPAQNFGRSFSQNAIGQEKEAGSPPSQSQMNVMQTLVLPDLPSHKLDKNSLTPHEKILMAHLLSLEALILSMQALEAEGKLLPKSHMPKANNQYISLEREISRRDMKTPNARQLQVDILLLTQLYTSLSVPPSFPKTKNPSYAKPPSSSLPPRLTTGELKP